MNKFIFSFFLVLSLKLFAAYPEYQNHNLSKKSLWYFLECKDQGIYFKHQFIFHIDKNKVHSILEIGSRDLRDAFDLSEYFKCHVFAFECNPECLEVCEINDQRAKNVTLIKKAAWNKTGIIPFYPTIHAENKISNPGLSSCFKMNLDMLVRYSQDEIEVEATRLDDWLKEKEIKKIDLVCISAQGSSKQILEGMGDYLVKTKYIILECGRNHYEKESSIYDLFLHLANLGFEIIPTIYPYDFIFENKLIDK